MMRALLILAFCLPLYGQMGHASSHIRGRFGSGTISSGTDKQVAFYDGSGTILAGATGLLWTKGTGTFLMNGAGSVGIGPSNTSPTGTVHVYDARPTTGVTTQTIRAGAGQGATNLQDWQNNAGGNLFSVTPNGMLLGPSGDNLRLRADAGRTIILQSNNGAAQAEILTNGSVRTAASLLGGLAAATASASIVALPAGNVVHITGTTSIDTINTCDAANQGRHVVLIFDGILTVNDASNLRIAGAFTTTADDTLSLMCDGTNWYEIARSVN